LKNFFFQIFFFQNVKYDVGILKSRSEKFPLIDLWHSATGKNIGIAFFSNFDHIRVKIPHLKVGRNFWELQLVRHFRLEFDLIA